MPQDVLQFPSQAQRTSSAMLAQAAMAGDERAWSRLVEQYGGLVRSIARSHRLSEADIADVVQTTWLRAVEHLHRLNDPERVGAWLATVARRESLRILRGNAREIPSEDELLEREPDGTACVETELLAAERRNTIRRAVATLTPRHRGLLLMLSAEPCPSYEAIGAALDMPVGSIGPTRQRAIERLRCHPELQHLAAA